jgi:hypothetical protein
MKKTLIFLAAAVIIFVTAFLTGPFVIERQTIKETNVDEGTVGYNPTSVARSAAATTSITYLASGGASQVFRFDSEHADQVRLNLYVTASTSASKLNWYYQYSSNGDDWFSGDFSTTTIEISPHSSSTPIQTWVPGTTSFQAKSILLNEIVAKEMRVVFYATGAALSYYAEAIKQDN